MSCKIKLVEKKIYKKMKIAKRAMCVRSKIRCVNVRVWDLKIRRNSQDGLHSGITDASKSKTNRETFGLGFL